MIFLGTSPSENGMVEMSDFFGVMYKAWSPGDFVRTFVRAERISNLRYYSTVLHCANCYPTTVSYPFVWRVGSMH